MARFTAPSVPWGPLQSVLMYGAVWVIPLLLYVLLFSSGEFSPALYGFGTALDNENVEASALFRLIEAAALGGVIYLYLRSRSIGWGSLGLRRFPVGQALFYLIVSLVVFMLAIGVIFSLIHLLVPGFDADQKQMTEFSDAVDERPFLTLFALAVLPPIIEEIVFRGFIFPGLAVRMGVVWAAVLSSGMFAFAHLESNVKVYTFFLGLIFCALYVRFRSIIPGIILHAANNFMAYLALSA